MIQTISHLTGILSRSLSFPLFQATLFVGSELDTSHIIRWLYIVLAWIEWTRVFDVVELDIFRLSTINQGNTLMFFLQRRVQLLQYNHLSNSCRADQPYGAGTTKARQARQAGARWHYLSPSIYTRALSNAKSILTHYCTTDVSKDSNL